MSKKTMQDVPPMEPLEQNLADQPYGYVVTDGYEVASWRPRPAGPDLACTQVHLILPVSQRMRVVMRLKSPRALDELVGVLLQHRKDVWGPK